MLTAVQQRGRSMDHLPEVVQAVSTVVGVLTATISAVVVRTRVKAAREMRQIDVSAEWQGQMLTRITAVEAELQRERIRGDEMEREGFNWRKQAIELEWELKQARAERHALNMRVDSLDHENSTLRRQNEVLAAELRELHRQIRSGHQSISLAPASAVTTKTKIKPDDR